MSANGLKSTPGSSLNLADMPLPAEWILEGNPTAKGHVTIQSADKKQSCGIWECTAGKFKWISPWWETVMILEGEATIQEAGGSTYTLRPGDFGHLPLGVETTWTVKDHVRKIFFVVTQEPLNL
jgi:uncharacterized protein